MFTAHNAISKVCHGAGQLQAGLMCRGMEVNSPGDSSCVHTRLVSKPYTNDVMKVMIM